MRKFSKSNSGFTLIELLVVISIIGLLASVVLVSLGRARVKARDAKRIATLKQMVTALNMYYDTYGQYPDVQNPNPAGSGCWWIWEPSNSKNSPATSFLQPLVSAGVLAKIPQEDYFTGCVYRYARWDWGGFCGYNRVAALYVLLENPRPLEGAQPACLNGVWGEAGAADPNGYLVLLKEN